MERGDYSRCAHLLKEKNSSYLIKKSLALIKHPISRNDIERQLRNVTQCVFVSQNGYYVEELPDIMELIDIVRELEHENFEEPLLKLIGICGIPPRMKKASDVLVYSKDIQEYFSWFGYMLGSIYNLKQQEEMGESLIKLLSNDLPHYKQYLSLSIRREKAHASRLCEFLGEFLEVAHDSIRPKLIAIILLLIEGTEVDSPIRKEFIQKQTIWNLIVAFEPTWRERIPHTRPTIPTGTEEVEGMETAIAIIFNLLKYPHLKDPDVLKPPANFTLWSLQWAYRLFCIKQAREVERNNILAILLKILDVFPDMLSGNLTFAYDIAKLAMLDDFHDSGHWSRYVIITSSSENFDFINLTLMCIAYFPHMLSGNKIMEECRVVQGLIKIVTNQQKIKWPKKHHYALVHLCLDVFSCISVCTSEEFLECCGPYSILEAIELIKSSPDADISLLMKCVEVLNQYSVHSRYIKDSIYFNEGVYTLLSLCEEILNNPILTLAKQNLLSTSFNLLHKLVKTEDEMKATMPSIMNYLRRYYTPKTKDPVMDPSVLCFVLKLLWDIFLKSDENSHHFVKEGGVYLLLDIIYVSCFSVKLVALGALVDLCCTIQCIPYLITWRKDEKRIISLLMEIFRKENKRLHVKVGPNGEIIDTRIPIMGNIQFYNAFCLCQKEGGNPAIADLFISCRPKIYCLLKILNDYQADTVEIANDFYRLYDEKLTLKDQVTLLVAENFLALKLSEEWQELSGEFERFGFKPTPADQTTITSMVEVTQKWGEALQNMQKDVIAYNNSQERVKEMELYQQLREARLSDALDGLFQLKKIARTSEKMFKISTNYKMMNTVESNLEYKESLGTLHRTFASRMSIALIGAPLVNYVDTRSIDMDKQSKDIHFVSPVQSFTHGKARISWDLESNKEAYCSKDLLHTNNFFE